MVAAYGYEEPLYEPVSMNQLLSIGHNAIDSYYDMLERVQQGDITDEVWYKYCTEVLTTLMEENKDVFVRLKER
jgi:hypothetical protein